MENLEDAGAAQAVKTDPAPSKAFKSKQLLTFSNLEDLNAIWTKVKVYRKKYKLKTMGDAVLGLIKYAFDNMEGKGD